MWGEGEAKAQRVQRSVGDEGVRAEDIHRAPQTGMMCLDAKRKETACRGGQAVGGSGFADAQKGKGIPV